MSKPAETMLPIQAITKKGCMLCLIMVAAMVFLTSCVTDIPKGRLYTLDTNQGIDPESAVIRWNQSKTASNFMMMWSLPKILRIDGRDYALDLFKSFEVAVKPGKHTLVFMSIFNTPWLAKDVYMFKGSVLYIDIPVQAYMLTEAGYMEKGRVVTSNDFFRLRDTPMP